MAGYCGYSMSNNAVSAYEDGEMPLSKWTKQAIFEYIADNLDNGENLIERLTSCKVSLQYIRQWILSYEGWHHTSKFYNKTNFYSVDLDYCELLMESEDEWNEFIGRFHRQQSRAKAEKQIAKLGKLSVGSVLKHNGRTYTKVANEGSLWVSFQRDDGTIIEVHLSTIGYSGDMDVEKWFWEKFEREENKNENSEIK